MASPPPTAGPNDAPTANPPTKAEVSKNIIVPNPNVLRNRIFRCPPQSPMAVILSFAIILGLLWSTVLANLPSKDSAGGPLFTLFQLLVAAYVGGKLMYITSLPSLLGMMAVGFGFSQIPEMNLKSLSTRWTPFMRNVALAINLTRMVLQLDPRLVRPHMTQLLLLALLPSLAEICTVAILSHFLLHHPWSWALLFGLSLSGLSAQAVIPTVFRFHGRCSEEEDKLCVPIFLTAVTLFNNIMVIIGFDLCMGFILAPEGSMLWILKNPLELLIGIAYGIALTLVSWLMPKDKQVTTAILEFLVLFLGNMLSMMGSQAMGFGHPSAGSMVCFICTVVMAQGWRITGAQVKHVNTTFSALWSVFAPVLFAIVAALVNIDWIDSCTIGFGSVVIFGGLSVKCIVSAIILFKGNFSSRDKLLIILTQIPKATIQATLGPVAMEMINIHNPDAQMEKYSHQILVVTVMSMLLTAPVTSLTVSVAASRILKLRNPSQLDTENG